MAGSPQVVDVSVDIEELVLWLCWHWVLLMAGQGASYVCMFWVGEGFTDDSKFKLAFFLSSFSRTVSLLEGPT